jgi:hypothetical protein
VRGHGWSVGALLFVLYWLCPAWGSNDVLYMLALLWGLYLHCD